MFGRKRRAKEKDFLRAMKEKGRSSESLRLRMEQKKAEIERFTKKLEEVEKKEDKTNADEMRIKVLKGGIEAAEKKLEQMGKA